MMGPEARRQNRNEPSIARGAAEPSDLTMENGSPWPDERGLRRPGDRSWRCGGNLPRLFLRLVLFHCAAALGTTIAGGTMDGHGKTRTEACYGIFVGAGRDAGFAYERDAWELGGGT